MKNKGITLIALVITIVVLIILAAVAINLSLGNNGIFNRAKTGKELYQNSEVYEKDQISIGTNQIDGMIDGNRGMVTLTEEEYEIFKNQTTYSLDEKLIGKWFDNKNLYRRIIPITMPAYSSGDYIDKTITLSSLSLDNVDTFIRVYGYIPSKNKNIPFQSGNTFIEVFVNNPKDRLYIRHNNPDFSNVSAYAIIEYTK